jgi:tetratricopeptide (TPR) repeat protein
MQRAIDRFDKVTVELVDLIVIAMERMRDDGHEGLANNLLQRIQRLGSSNDANSQFFRLRFLQVRAQIYRNSRRYDEALECFQEILSLLRPEDLEYNIEAAGFVRTLFDKGDENQAFEFLGHIIVEGMDIGIDQEVIYDYVALSSFGRFKEGIRIGVFRDAIIRFAVDYLKQDRSVFDGICADDPDRALAMLLAADPNPDRWFHSNSEPPHSSK